MLIITSYLLIRTSDVLRIWNSIYSLVTTIYLVFILMSNIVVIDIENIDKKFLPYIKLNHKLKRIESYKCPVPGCDFKTKQGPGAVRMHTMIRMENVASTDDPKGVDHKAHIQYYKTNDALTLDDVKKLARTDTRPYSERDV